MIFFYHLLSIFAVILLVPLFTLVSLFSQHKWKGLAHHFGWVPAKNRASEKTLWLQALSMGEVIAATPVLKQVREQNPDLYIALSVTTDSGYSTALNLDFVDSLFFHPLDCLPFTQMALHRINPDLYVVTDTGFWPGLIDLLHRKKCPALLFNGRISQRSLQRYLRIGSLFKETFQKFRQLCMQNIQAEQAALALGATPMKITVIGDPKYDALPIMTQEEEGRLRQTFKLDTHTQVWVAGSTHAGEEEVILNAYRQLLKPLPDLVLILAPRRIERTQEVATLIKMNSFTFSYRSSQGDEAPQSIILLDSIGELAQVYALGQIAFVGNSLIKPGGGHSLIEPLSHGLPVLHGPHIENIGHVAELAHHQGLAFLVQNAQDLSEQLQTLLANKSHLEEIAQKSRTFITQQQGASAIMTATITKYL